MNLRSITKLGLVSLLIAACSGGGTTDNQQPTYDPTLPEDLTPTAGVDTSEYSGLWLQTIRLEGDIFTETFDGRDPKDLGDIKLVQNQLFAFSPTSNSIDVQDCNHGTDDNTPLDDAEPVFTINQDGQLFSSTRKLISDSKLDVMGWDFVLPENLASIEQTILANGTIHYQTDSNIRAGLTISIQMPEEEGAQTLPFDYLGSASIEWVKISDNKDPLPGLLKINDTERNQISCFSSHYANLKIDIEGIGIKGQARQINQISSGNDRLSLLLNTGFNSALGGFDKKTTWRLGSEARPTSRLDSQMILDAPLPDIENRQFTGSFSTTFNGDASGELMIQF